MSESFEPYGPCSLCGRERWWVGHHGRDIQGFICWVFRHHNFVTRVSL